MRRIVAGWSKLVGPDADPRRRIFLAFMIAGGLAAFAGTLVPDPDPSDHEELAVLALACLAVAGLLARWRTPPEQVLASLPALGILMVSAAVATAEPLAATPTYYLLPLLASAYFGTPLRLAADLCLFAASFVLVLAVWVEPEARVAIFLGTAIPAVFVAAMMSSLRRRLDAHVAGLRRLAATDALTGTLNHGAFRAQLDTAVERASAGGEEFALLLSGADAQAAQLVAARIRGALRAATVLEPASLTLSVGIAERSDEVATSHALLAAADRALYLAKDRGRDQAVLVPVAA